MRMPKMSEVEAEAMAIVWANEGGSGEPSEEDQVRILAQIRERAARIEEFVREDMLMAKMREGRRNPRRHELIAFALFMALFLTIALITLISSYWPF